MLAVALLALLAVQPSNAARIPPATPTYRLPGPVNFCAEEFSVRLVQGETVEWIAYGRDPARYAIRSGEIEASVGWWRELFDPAPDTAVTDLRLPLSPITRRYVLESPDRTEMDARGNQREGRDYSIIWYLYGAARTATPVKVIAQSGNRRLELPFVSRIDPRPLRARRCRLSRSDPALARRIRVEPGR